MLKIVSIHTDRVDARRRASSNLHTSNERCQFKLYMYSYWSWLLAIGLLITINCQNVRVAIGLHHQTTSVFNDVIDNDVTDNNVTDSWMNMHTLLASRPKCGHVDASWREATRRARCERGFTLTALITETSTTRTYVNRTPTRVKYSYTKTEWKNLIRRECSRLMCFFFFACPQFSWFLIWYRVRKSSCLF